MPPTYQMLSHVLLPRDLSSSALAVRIVIPAVVGILAIIGAILLWHRRRIWTERTKDGGRDGVRRVYG